jgi:SAM-dependent methyltransferase
MKSTLSDSQLQVELKRIYDVRFTGKEEYRNQVWQVLVSKFFSRWIDPGDAVLDVGCGYGEFINNVVAREKYGIDLNPSSVEHVDRKVRLIQQDCTKPWPLRDSSIDVVFSSNFFEHLPTKQDLQALLLEAFRCLRPGGRLMTLGPNVKYLSGSYWDFFDHHLPLTELSLSEAMIMAGFEVEAAIGKFLPYTMSQGRQPPLWMLHLYLGLPMAWHIFGKQFLVRARKPR